MKGRRALQGAESALRLLGANLSRAMGWVLGLFTAFNLFGDILLPGFDANHLWMPVGFPGPTGTKLFLVAFAILLIWSLLRPRASAPRYAITQAVILFLAFQAMVQIIEYYRAMVLGVITADIPVPFAALVFLALCSQIWRVRRGFAEEKEPATDTAYRVLATAAGMLLVWEAFLIGQFYLVGGVRAEERVDCIVVMGAAINEYGLPSVSLRDRVATGSALYHRGVARHLIMSGGQGRFGDPECEWMARLADHHEVPVSALILDHSAHSSFDTVRACKEIFRERGWRTALVVSHDFHLSRTRLAFERAGMPVSTYPARRSLITYNDFFHIGRESAAWTWYYFRPFWQPFMARADT